MLRSICVVLLVVPYCVNAKFTCCTTFTAMRNTTNAMKPSAA